MSARRFSVGDRVRIVRPGSRRFGQITTIVDAGSVKDLVNLDTGRQYRAFAYMVDITPRPGFAGVSYEPRHLEPYYDGKEPAQWADCAWRPNEVAA